MTLLSDQQKEILGQSGRFVVRACPGSGKTFSVTAKLAALIKEWEEQYAGVAVLSFTNVASEEIRNRCISEFGIQIDYPHFVGTIDSFLNQFIFLPFGHLVMKCSSRPKLVGNPHGIWTGSNFSESVFDSISIDINGDWYWTGLPSKMPKDWQKNTHIIRAKQQLIRKGFATQADANYFAMEILRNHPFVAKTLAVRFPTIIVDEAQDTTEIQMNILDALIKNGLENIVLVGDPDQAIYEWNDAKPELFSQKFEEWSSSSITLSDSFRSSQRICNALTPLSSLPVPLRIKAKNPDVSGFDSAPEIWTYDKSDVQSIVDRFLENTRKLGIEVSPQNVAVLCRSKDFANEILGEKADVQTGFKPFAVWKDYGDYTKDFAYGKFLADKDDYYNGGKYLERGFVKAHRGLSYCSEIDIEKYIKTVGYIEFKKGVYRLLQTLPNTEVTIGEWVQRANVGLSAAGFGFSFAIQTKASDLPFSKIFPDKVLETSKTPFRLSTIHGVKGETFDAVLVLLKSRAGNRGSYLKLLKSTDIATNEELRILYVGLSRPRKYLVLAIPDTENLDEWKNLESMSGFKFEDVPLL